MFQLQTRTRGEQTSLIDEIVGNEKVLLELVQRQFFQRLALADAGGHHRTGTLIGIAEGHTLLGQVVGAVGGVDKALGGGAAHIGGQRGHGSQHRRDGAQAKLQRIHRIKNCLFVLLHILVIGQGDALHHDQQRVQIAVDAPGLAADQFRDIGVFLLRHDGRAGRKRIVQLNELELPAAPQDDLLAQAGEVHHAGGHGAAQLNAEIAVGHAVDGVAAGGGKAQLLRRVEAVILNENWSF